MLVSALLGANLVCASTVIDSFNHWSPSSTYGEWAPEKSPATQSGADNWTVSATGFGGAFQAVYSTVDVTSVGIKTESVVEHKVYPNPTSDYINFDSNNQIDEVILTDMAGKVVYEGKNLGTFTKLDISKFKKGTYVLTTVEKGVYATQQIIFN